MSEEKNNFISRLESALGRIKHPRHYESERGYQAELYAELRAELPHFGWDNSIVEQEYQKRIKDHNTTIRPDLIIHVPFDPNKHNTRREGNFVVFELKLNSNTNEKKAVSDYKNLAVICEKLSYPFAVFIIINGDSTYIDKYDGEHKDKILAYTVKLVGGNVEIHREPTT